MKDQTQIEPLGEHRYLVRIPQEGEDTFDIEIHATAAITARLTTDQADETRVIEAAAAYLLARQRGDDLPSELDFDDIAAAYPGFEDDLRQQLHHCSHPESWPT